MMSFNILCGSKRVEGVMKVYVASEDSPVSISSADRSGLKACGFYIHKPKFRSFNILCGSKRVEGSPTLAPTNYFLLFQSPLRIEAG